MPPAAPRHLGKPQVIQGPVAPGHVPSEALLGAWNGLGSYQSEMKCFGVEFASEALMWFVYVHTPVLLHRRTLASAREPG